MDIRTKLHAMRSHSLSPSYLSSFIRSAEEMRAMEAGELPTYIPSLQRDATPYFGVAISHESSLESAGDAEASFSLQSISKLLWLALFLELRGSEALTHFFALKETAQPFNSLDLDEASGLPFDPCRNTGAMVLISHVLKEMGHSDSCKLDQKLESLLGVRLSCSEQDAIDALAVGHRNREILVMLDQSRLLAKGPNPEEVVRAYYRGCFWTLTVTSLSQALKKLIDSLSFENQKSFLDLVSRFGMYGASKDWMRTVGIPAKSSVSGVIAGFLPNHEVITVFAPGLDEVGNSLRGSRFFRKFAQTLRGASS